MKIISIIPARGGSKSLPRKNLVEFLGEPLINKTIEQSINSEYIDKTIVSTDNQEIKQQSLKYNLEVIDRPKDISGDEATTESAMMHVLETLKNDEDYIPDIVILLQVTSPLRKNDDIDNSIKKFIEEKSDSLISGSHFEDFLFWEKKNNDWEAVNYSPENRMRRQDRNPQFVENGSIYIFKPEILYKLNNRIGGKMTLYEMEFWQTWEIDTKEEIDLLEFYYKKFLIGEK
tara:strand:+ start:399 stop:1091 length:693 start_codon:yes stop_codon:yes gene_type:complete